MKSKMIGIFTCGILSLGVNSFGMDQNCDGLVIRIPHNQVSPEYAKKPDAKQEPKTSIKSVNLRSRTLKLLEVFFIDKKRALTKGNAQENGELNIEKIECDGDLLEEYVVLVFASQNRSGRNHVGTYKYESGKNKILHEVKDNQASQELTAIYNFHDNSSCNTLWDANKITVKIDDRLTLLPDVSPHTLFVTAEENDKRCGRCCVFSFFLRKASDAFFNLTDYVCANPVEVLKAVISQL
jgi:hypothetical protein